MNTNDREITVTRNSSNMTVSTVTWDSPDMTVTMTCESSDVEDDVTLKFEYLDDDYYNALSHCPLKREKHDSSNDKVENDLETPPPASIFRDESDIKPITLYVCSVCSKILPSQGRLRTHIQQLHTEENIDELCPLKQTKLDGNSFKTTTVHNCLHCTKTFKYKQSLRRHVTVFHGNGVENAIKISVNTSKFSFTCLTCSKMFSTNRCLRQHMRRRHSDSLGKVVAKRARRACDVESTLTHSCSLCDKVYLSRSTLRTHIRSAHEDVDVNSVCVPMKKSCMKCPVCLYDFDGVINPTMASVIHHLNTAHGENLEFQQLTFASENEFTDWLTNVENETPCNFQRKYCRGDKSNFVQYFYCSRSGVSSYRARLPNQRQRRLKGQGNSRIGRTCPAHVILTSKGDLSFDVKYLSKHFCHSDVYDQLGHIRMTHADRQYIADKLEQNLSFDEILRDVRVDLVGTVQRRHIITRKDIYNVARALNLKRSNGDQKEARASVQNDKVLRKEFDRLTARCKGKLSRRKLWMLRNRHAKALSLDVTMWEVASGLEWVVSSEENDKDVFTVTRLNDDTCLKVDCEMHCAECEACVHDYQCTCADYVAAFVMCKHVHLVCQRRLALGNLETDDARACDSSSLVEEVTHDDEPNDLNIFHSIFQPSQISFGSEFKDEVSQECLRLTAKVTSLIQPIPDTKHIAQIIDSSSRVDCFQLDKRKDPNNSNKSFNFADRRITSYDDRSLTRSGTLLPSRDGNKPVILVTSSPHPRCRTSEISAPQNESLPGEFYPVGCLVCSSSLLADGRVSASVLETTIKENDLNTLSECTFLEIETGTQNNESKRKEAEEYQRETQSTQHEEVECIQEDADNDMLELVECTV